MKRDLPGAAPGAIVGMLLVGGPLLGAAAGAALTGRTFDRVECVTRGTRYLRG
jgi:hypothetical protein